MVKSPPSVAKCTIMKMYKNNNFPPSSISTFPLFRYCFSPFSILELIHFCLVVIQSLPKNP